MDAAVLGALIAGAASIVAGWLTFVAAKDKRRTDAGQFMIDQHQEDIVELRRDRDEQKREIGALQRTQRIQGDYIGQLRRHIADGNPPPPPPYPDGLIT